VTEIATETRTERTTEGLAGLMNPPAGAAVTAAEPVVAAPAVAVPTRRGASALPASDEHVLRRLGRDVLRGLAIVAVLHLFVVQISVVRGLSMEPSLHDGDRLIVDRLSYSFADVTRFDVVVLRNPRDPSVDFVKRVVGMPGERVAIRAGRISVNGDVLPAPFEHVDDSCNMDELIVPADHFFVLGDNRPVSCDSREFGLVQGALLKGKVRARFWPLDRLTVF
jgi:signal peptidase I